MENSGIILEYKGHLTFTTIGRLLTMLKHKMVQEGIHTGVYKRILGVMIEALENIYKNSDSYQHLDYIRNNHLPGFEISKNETRFYMTVGNPIINTEIKHLVDRLELVNNKTLEELRILYRQTIMNGAFSKKGGAGLGLIEIAKISGNPMQYSFTPISEDFSYYTLKITFN